MTYLEQQPNLRDLHQREYNTLYSMLQVRRRADTPSEKKFVKHWVEPLGTISDAFGNQHLKIGNAPVIWSCHTDTVHNAVGKTDVRYEPTLDLFSSGSKAVLGADDAAGVWLMREMIREKIPGLYIFHRCEEIGGQGSAYIADHAPDLIAGYKYAIAFDRRGRGDVITHQGARCCSDVFAQALSDLLAGSYRPDDSGVFTDTANYVHLVPECTNISVGYESEHTSKETLDFAHLLQLRDKLITLDFSKLPVVRKTDDPADYRGSWWTGVYGSGDAHYPFTNAVTDYWDDQNKLPDSAITRPLTSKRYGVYSAFDALLDMVQRYPYATADLLDEYGITAQEVEDRIGQQT